MAKRSLNEVKVGITVLAALALTMYIVITLADWSNLFTTKNDITMSLPYDLGLQGLDVGSTVYVGGAKIGQIVSTRIDPPSADGDPCALDNGRVYFTMRIPASYPLRSDCQLAVESNMLGSQANLAIYSMGTRDGELLMDGAVQELGKENFYGGAMASLMRRFDEKDPCSWICIMDHQLDVNANDSLLGNLVAASASVESLAAAVDTELTLDPEGQSVRSQIRAIIENIRVVLAQELDRENAEAALAKINAALDRMNSILTTTDEWTTTNAPVLTDTVSHVQGIAAETHEALPGIIAQVDTILGNVNESMDIARTALLDAQALIRDGRQMVIANRAKVDRIVDDLREVAINLRVTSREVRRAPWRILYTPTSEEIEMEAVVETAGRFVYGAERLSDLSTELREALEADGEAADPERIQAIIDQLEETYGHFEEVETELWDRIQ
ncbi:MAG: hypothetical protein JW936_11240 [Sedimentisphaerales bacterium]|nr:hypothetical protein [Sedimentisphaerales bacterium]